MNLRPPAVAMAFLVCVAAGADDPFHGTVDDRGVVVGASMSDLREGSPSRITVTLRDRASDSALRGVFPSAWLSERNPAKNEPCASQVAAFLSGSLLTRADVDLNEYEVAALNADGTITVVDPRFSFGGTRLLAMIDLKGPGYDWALTAGGSRLAVAVPSANQIAILDTASWTIVATVKAKHPTRIVAQPDSDVVWVAAEDALLAVRADGSIAARLNVAKARDLAVSHDGAFVVAVGATSATIIDAERRVVAGTVAAKKPISIAWSPLSRMMYAASADGSIVAFDPAAPARRAAIRTEAGVRQIRFSRDGRFGFVVNPEKDLVSVIDAVTNRVIQRGTMDGGPFDVSFSDGLAYVRRLRSEVVLMVPLADLGKPGHPIAVVDFPAGDQPFGKGTGLVPAEGIVTAPGDGAVLVAHPGDRNIYYYREGMAAPMGHFPNYGHEPRAVLAIDRTLQALAPGVFTTTARLPHAGQYTLAVFVDSPRAVACFDVAVAPDAEQRARRANGPRVEQLTATRVVAAGGSLRARFRLVDPKSGHAIAGARDVELLLYLAATGWNERKSLRPEADGVYETDLVLPKEGIYYAFLESASAGLRSNNPDFLVLEAKP